MWAWFMRSESIVTINYIQNNQLYVEKWFQNAFYYYVQSFANYVNYVNSYKNVFNFESHVVHLLQL